MELTVSRRTFLKTAGAAAGASALGQGGLLSLTALTPEQAAAMQTASGSYQVRYTADVMCPSECGM